MKKKKKIKEIVWTSGITPKTNMSYEKYLKSGLEILSGNLSLRSYKLAPKEEYPFFERGRDVRVGFFWKGKPAIDNKGNRYEFVLESSFWLTSNTNKEDRAWMRSHADVHLKNFYDAIQRGKKKTTKKKTTKKKSTKKTKVGSTQVAFDEMKKSKK